MEDEDEEIIKDLQNKTEGDRLQMMYQKLGGVGTETARNSRKLWFNKMEVRFRLYSKGELYEASEKGTKFHKNI